MNLISKINFILIKPSLCLIVGGDSQLPVKEALLGIRSQWLKKKTPFIFENKLESRKDTKKAFFLIKNSKKPVVIINYSEEIFKKGSFSEKEKSSYFLNIKRIVEKLPPGAFLILNFDDKIIRQIKNITSASVLTFGFKEGADIKASDVRINPDSINFKVNYQDKIVPVWLNKVSGKEQVYRALSVVSFGLVFNLNLVKISQFLKEGLSV